MECQECGEQDEPYRDSCKHCGKKLPEEIPSCVLLNQIPGGKYGPPTNIPLQALGIKEILKASKTFKGFLTVIASIGIIVLLTVIIGLIIYKFCIK